MIRQEVCDDDEDTDECPVCMDPFGDRETIVLTKCQHRYHTDCRAGLEEAGFEGCSYRCEGSVLAAWISGKPPLPPARGMKRRRG